MGGKGAKGAVDTNGQIVAMQQQQAAQATQANQERNARLNYGTQNIKNIFEGTPTGSTPPRMGSIAVAAATARSIFRRRSLRPYRPRLQSRERWDFYSVGWPACISN